MMTALLFAAFGAVAPLEYDDPKYVRDWYAPPPDWTPATSILHYNANVRTPETVWVEYKGSYGPGVRIAPIPAKWLDLEADWKLLREPQKRAFDLEREKTESFRRVVTMTPEAKGEWASEFTNLTFRVKSSVSGAGANLVVNAVGVGRFATAECKSAAREGDVTTYSFPIAKGRKTLQKVEITVDPITVAPPQGRQEITVFDLHFKCAKAYAPFKSPAPRRFVRVDGSAVEDIQSAIEGAPAEVVKALPVKGWAASNLENLGGATVETVTEDFGGEKIECLRMTFTKPADEKQRFELVTLPFALNALEWNTYAFYYRVETPTGAKILGDAPINRIPQYFMFDRYLDNPGVSFASREDRFDYNRWGVTRQHLSSGRRPEAKCPNGWKFFACDMVNDDPTGNKWFSLDKITDYEFTFRVQHLKPGEKVVFTVAKPKAVRGLMLAGGDMRLWEDFKAWRKGFRPRAYADALKDDVWAKGRLAEPVPAMRDRLANIEIVNLRNWSKNPVGRDFAAKLLRDTLMRVLNPLNEIAILSNAASTNDNVKLFLGVPAKASAEVKEKVRAQREACKGTAATIIVRDGRSFYFTGADDFRTVGEDKGVIDGILDFLEANCGAIWPRPVAQPRGNNPGDAPYRYPLITRRDVGEDFDITWGDDYVASPAMRHWGFSNGYEEYAYLNRANFFGCWYGRSGVDFSAYRTFAANHWFGFGAGKDENEKWGMNAEGKRLKPGCYTSTPCLVKVLEDAKDDFLSGKFITAAPGLPEKTARYARFADDAQPCWIEDTWQTCQCAECLKPFRLPDGSLVTKDDPDFKAEATMVNANAYNQMVRTYANRDSELNYLVYFYTIPVPRTPVSRYVRAHFCPYVRVNYDIPIYAPVNDKFWRIICQWGQVARSMGVSEYFLGGHFRPKADVLAFDLDAYRQVGVMFFGQETETNDRSFAEMWAAQRLIYRPDLDPDAIRAYYCSKTFGDAAELVYGFFSKIRALRYTEHRDTDFEETGWSELGWLACRTPSDKWFCDNLAEELDRDLEKAADKAEGDPVASFYVGKLRAAWKTYYADAKKETVE